MKPIPFINIIERALTEPNAGRVAVLLLVLGALLFADHIGGFTHHYDVKHQVQELNALREGPTPDSIVREKMDSVRTSILNQIRSRQTPPSEELERKARLYTATPTAVFFLLVSVILLVYEDSRFLEDDEEGAPPFTRLYRTFTGLTVGVLPPYLAVGLVPPQGSIQEAIAMAVLSQIGMYSCVIIFISAIGPSLDEVIDRIRAKGTDKKKLDEEED